MRNRKKSEGLEVYLEVMPKQKLIIKCLDLRTAKTVINPCGTTHSTEKEPRQGIKRQPFIAKSLNQKHSLNDIKGRIVKTTYMSYTIVESLFSLEFVKSDEDILSLIAGRAKTLSSKKVQNPYSFSCISSDLVEQKGTSH